MKSRYFFAIAIIGLLTSGGLIINYQHNLNQLADAAISQDQQGDPSAKLAAVETYAKKHMGTSVSVNLKGSYNRAAQAAQSASNPASNGQLYSDAQKSCSSKADSITLARCVQAYLASHATVQAPNPQVATAPNQNDYTKSYKGPLFSLDGAGIALIIAVVSLAIGVGLLFRKSNVYRGPQS